MLGEGFNLPGGTYTPSATGIINVAPSDVPFAIAAGCTPAPVSALINPTSTAAAGTTQATAAVLPTGGGVYPVSGASGTNGVIIAPSDAVVGRQILITNPVAQALLIYPPNVGGNGTINAGAANAAYSTASAKGALLTCLSVSGLVSTWMAL
jgi:hypothetical protein